MEYLFLLLLTVGTTLLLITLYCACIVAKNADENAGYEEDSIYDDDKENLYE